MIDQWKNTADMASFLRGLFTVFVRKRDEKYVLLLLKRWITVVPRLAALAGSRWVDSLCSSRTLYFQEVLLFLSLVYALILCCVGTRTICYVSQIGIACLSTVSIMHISIASTMQLIIFDCLFCNRALDQLSLDAHNK